MKSKTIVILLKKNMHKNCACIIKAMFVYVNICLVYINRGMFEQKGYLLTNLKRAFKALHDQN